MNNKIKETHHAFLPLSNGLRLAYRAWMPVDAEQNPVPAILEFLPYRKNDGTIVRDEITMPATAKQGYACVRVDIRGTGESDGLFDDEYSEQELSDAEQVIDWISKQPWCDGKVGMVGISWGGFNSLQLAYRQPPALKAIITICSTDDRFNEDIHYAGGCLLNDNLDWASFFWAYAQARCPDPRLIGDGWREQWLERLENMPFLPKKWLSEQSKSAYWKHGSVSEDYNRIKIPVYAIGGWADAYRNTVFRLIENLSSPSKGLVGPWAHVYPNIAYPDPRIDYVKESVRWWDKWLKNIDNDIMAEPAMQYYLMDPVKPARDYVFREGSWRGEPGWPANSITNKCFHLHPEALAAAPCKQSRSIEIHSPQTTGQMAGKLMVGIGYSGEYPDDQRLDDEASCTFDTKPLEKPLDVVGQAVAHLQLSSDQPVSNVAVRLCDLHPSGESTLITYGVLNLTHRDSNEAPQALVPGKTYEIKVPLHHIAYRLPKGHCLRLAVSNAYWPLVWPSPHNDTLRLEVTGSFLSLPCCSSNTVNSNPALDAFTQEVSPNGKELREGCSRKTIWQDETTGVQNIRTQTDYGQHWHRSCDTSIDFSIDQIMSIHPDDPNSAKSESTLAVNMQQGETDTSLLGYYEMTSSSEHYFIKAKWQAFADGECIFEKMFDEKIKRNLL